MHHPTNIQQSIGSHPTPLGSQHPLRQVTYHPTNIQQSIGSHPSPLGSQRPLRLVMYHPAKHSTQYRFTSNALWISASTSPSDVPPCQTFNTVQVHIQHPLDLAVPFLPVTHQPTKHPTQYRFPSNTLGSQAASISPSNTPTYQTFNTVQVDIQHPLNL